ncbi:MAG: hypothetical protein ACJAW8_001082 [Oleispira sp.]|jgi:hypothetical protein
MVKKTLLSLAIAASTAGLTACNISSTADNNEVATDPVTAGTAGNLGLTTPIFSAANSKLPLANDLIFAINSQLADGKPGKDGTANVDDTIPPVTTAINKLDGFSTSAAHYINFTAALNPATVIAGQTVFLIKLKNGTDSAAINPLDLQTIIDNGGASPFSATQPVDNLGNPLYEANYVTLDGGATHTIQILPKTPLEPKTKYFVVLTDSIKDSAGQAVGESSEYTLVSGNLELPSAALAPVRTAVQGWEKLSGLFLAGATNNAITQNDIVLSYAFTTTGTTDVLHAMAAPGTFLTSQIPSIAHAEGAITASVTAKVTAQFPAGTPQATIDATVAANVTGTLNAVAEAVAIAINEAMPGTLPTTDGASIRPTLKATAALQPSYYQGLITAIANANDAPTGLDAIVDKPKSRTYTPIVSAPATAVAVPYDTLLTAQVTPKVEAAIPDIATAEGAISASVIAKATAQGASQAVAEGAAASQLDDIAELVAIAINEAQPGTLPTTDGATIRPTLKSTESLMPSYLAGLRKAIVTGQVADLSSGGAIYQGGLTLPNYLPNAQAGVADNALGSWSGSNNAALALGLPGAPTDVNGEINVSYRFPFADKVGENTIPVMVTLPKADCDPDGAGPASGKPADGWPVAIYQHGITVDRTAGVLVGNTLAGQCIAMVAIDHAMHGIAPLNGDNEANSLRLFNVEQVAAAEAATNSPFAAARAGWIQAVGGAANAPELAALAERHSNVAKNALNANIDMVFQGALDSEGDPVTTASVGTSGQLYINLNNFTRTRDGIRQTVLDMLNLGASIGDMDINADGTANDLDPSKIYFIGHSLGGIVGATFLAVNNNADVRAYNSSLPKIQAAALGNPGGGFVKLLENSPSIGAKVLGGLQAASGITQGSESIEKFFAVFQATVDSADPINFAADTQDIPVLVYTDVGGLASEAGDDDDGALSDQVVPNNALTPTMPSAKSYLAGTDALVTEMGITTLVNQTNAVAGGAVTADPKYYFPNGANDSLVRANIRFTQGTHSTFSSGDPKDVFAETYQQIITYFDPYGATKLLGLPGDQKGFVIENTTALELEAAE